MRIVTNFELVHYIHHEPYVVVSSAILPQSYKVASRIESFSDATNDSMLSEHGIHRVARVSKRFIFFQSFVY